MTDQEMLALAVRFQIADDIHIESIIHKKTSF
jgi:hypothetical protein